MKPEPQVFFLRLITTHSYGKNSSFALDNLHVRLIFDLDKKSKFP